MRIPNPFATFPALAITVFTEHKSVSHLLARAVDDAEAQLGQDVRHKQRPALMPIHIPLHMPVHVSVYMSL